MKDNIIYNFNKETKMIFPMYIGGKWYEGSTKDYRDVISPATGEIIGQIPMGNKEDADKALKEAKKAAPILEDMSVFERAELCNRVSDAIAKRREELAKLLCREHGKPYYTEAIGEVEWCILSFREAAEQIKWMNDEIIPLHDKNKRAFVYRKPLGVYVAITPWNYPIGLASPYYLAPGLAAGNAIVWSPATSTSAVSSLFMKCFEDADLPKGAINLLIGRGSVVGDACVVHPLTDAIGFTGSAETGDIIESRAKVKNTSMELGGNGPTIVFKDADLEQAAEEIMLGSYTNSGQICTSTERVIIDNAIADKLIKIMMSKIQKYCLGDPFDRNTTMGPMHDKGTVQKVLDHIKDAVERGAKIITGGKLKNDAPTKMYVEPTIIDHVSPDALMNIDETFGPVIPLIRYKSENEIDGITNMSRYNLAASIFTTDIRRALIMGEKMKFGYTQINSRSSAWETPIPAGGCGAGLSGHGRNGGKWSIEDMSELRTVILNLV